MNNSNKGTYFLLEEDKRLRNAIQLFNRAEWYSAHDAFEEIWHETIGPERVTIQGILQISVAQLHLERGNLNGATILYGEALGRLKSFGIPDLKIDLNKLIDFLQQRLLLLQNDNLFDHKDFPFLEQNPD